MIRLFDLFERGNSSNAKKFRDSLASNTLAFKFMQVTG